MGPSRQILATESLRVCTLRSALVSAARGAWRFASARPWAAVGVSGCAAVALCLVIFTWKMCLTHFLRMPYFDTLLMAFHFEEHGMSWFYPAVDHLLVLPMWPLAFDYFFRQASGEIVVLCSLVSSLLMGLGCALGLGSLWRRRPEQALLWTSAIFGLLFWLGNALSWIWTIQVAVQLSLVIAVLALLLLSRLDIAFRAENRQNDNPELADAPDSLGVAPRLGWVVGICFAALASVLSFGYGLLVLPVATVAAWAGRWPKAAKWVFGGATLASAVFYLSFIRRGRFEVHSPTDVLSAPLDALSFFFAFLGAPFRFLLGDLLYIQWRQGDGAIPDLTIAAQVFGLLTFLVLGGLAARCLLQRRGVPRPAPTLLATYLSLMVFGGAFLVTVSRFRQGLGQAFAPRYLALQIFLWVALALFAAGWQLQGYRPAAEGRRGRGLLFLGPQIAVPGFLALLVVTLPIPTARLWDRVFQTTVPTMAGLVRVEDTQPYSVLLPRKPKAARRAAWLFSNQARGPYAQEWAKTLGQPFAEHFVAISPRQCRAEVGPARPVLLRAGAPGKVDWRAGARIEGKAWNLADDRPLRRVVAVDAGGNIRGFGATGGLSAESMLSWRDHYRSAQEFLAFVDSVPNKPGDPREGWKVWGVTGGNKACELGPILEVGPAPGDPPTVWTKKR